MNVCLVCSGFQANQLLSAPPSAPSSAARRGPFSSLPEDAKLSRCCYTPLCPSMGVARGKLRGGKRATTRVTGYTHTSALQEDQRGPRMLVPPWTSHSLPVGPRCERESSEGFAVGPCTGQWAFPNRYDSDTPSRFLWTKSFIWVAPVVVSASELDSPGGRTSQLLCGASCCPPSQALLPYPKASSPSSLQCQCELSQRDTKHHWFQIKHLSEVSHFKQFAF